MQKKKITKRMTKAIKGPNAMVKAILNGGDRIKFATLYTGKVGGTCVRA